MSPPLVASITPGFPCVPHIHTHTARPWLWGVKCRIECTMCKCNFLSIAPPMQFCFRTKCIVNAHFVWTRTHLHSCNFSISIRCALGTLCSAWAIASCKYAIVIQNEFSFNAIHCACNPPSASTIYNIQPRRPHEFGFATVRHSVAATVGQRQRRVFCLKTIATAAPMQWKMCRKLHWGRTESDKWPGKNERKIK